MKRNFLLILALFLGFILIVNSAKRLSYLRTTAQKVDEAEKQLELLRRENESLKQELEYKKTNEFAEEEIRNKLGLAKPGEAVVILPNEEKQSADSSQPTANMPNWQKWWELFFGS